jgi:hypothetical protein
MDEIILEFPKHSERMEPVEALERLSYFVKNNRLADQDFLSRLQIKVESQQIVGSPTVWIRLRLPAKKFKGRTRKAWEELAVGPDAEGDPADVDFVPLRTGLANLLLSSGPQTDEVRDDKLDERLRMANEQGAARFFPHHQLLAVPDGSPKRGASLFWQLGCYVTQRRLTQAEIPGGVYQLIWVQNARDRADNLEALMSRGPLPEGQWLDCYVCNQVTGPDGRGWLVFVPGDTVPDKKALEYFCTILTDTSALVGTPPRKDARILAALVSQPGKNGSSPPHFLYMGNLKFYEEWELVSRAGEIRKFEWFNLEKSQVQVGKLAARIDKARPRVGYQLQLQPSHYTTMDEDESRRLKHLHREIQERLEELAGLNEQYPILLRFSAEQLPVLGDYIRYFSPAVLDQIKYGFTHTETSGEGLHFLCLDQEIEVQSDLDPLSWWGRFGQQTMRFWLDPGWARNYFEDSDAMLFVPQGMTLYPPVHSWEVAGMDQYLANTFLRVAKRQNQDVQIPKRPIYLFDGSGNPGEKLHLMVLNMDEFVPLNTKLGWLNDNLRLLTNLGLESFVSEMSSVMQRDLLARRLTMEADTSAAIINTRTGEIESAWIASTTSMIERLNKIVNDIVEESDANLKKAGQLNKNLSALQALYSEMRLLTGGATELITEVDQKTEELKNNYIEMARHVDRAIRDSGEQQKDWDQRVNMMVDDLRQSHNELQRRLEALRYLDR